MARKFQRHLSDLQEEWMDENSDSLGDEAIKAMRDYICAMKSANYIATWCINDRSHAAPYWVVFFRRIAKEIEETYRTASPRVCTMTDPGACVIRLR